MGLHTLSFIYLYLPAGLLVYYLAPKKWRPGVLLAFSLGYFAMAEPRSLALMLLSVGMDYAALLAMARWEEWDKARRFCCWFAVIKNLGIIVYIGIAAELSRTDAAFGYLVYTLLATETVLATYRREIPPERSLIRFGLHCCFFPRLMYGPLQPYGEFSRQIGDVRWNGERIGMGLAKYVQGTLKVLLLGNYLQEFAGTLYRYPAQDVTVLSSWLLILTVMLVQYFILSGYCDIAQGIGGLFGLELPENYRHPYQAHSITGFVFRFNGTFSRFLQKSVYETGLQGSKNGTLTGSLNVLICAMLFGLWFGVRVNYLAWGVFLGIFLVMETFLYPQVLRRVPVLFSWAYSFVVVLVSFSLFVGNSLAHSVSLMACLAGRAPAGVANDQVLYLLSTNWTLLLAGCLLSISFVGFAAERVRRAVPWLYWLVSLTSSGAMLVVATALLMP